MPPFALPILIAFLVAMAGPSAWQTVAAAVTATLLFAGAIVSENRRRR